MALQFGPKVVQNAKGTHSATIIFLHGLGGNGQATAALGPSFRLPHVKYIFPTAPIRPIQIYQGTRTNGWFDIDPSNLLTGQADHQGIKHSTDYINSLVQEEIAAGITPDRVVVGGFSQGGHVAVKFALQAPVPIRACLVLSSWLEPNSVQVPEANRATNVFIAHGKEDRTIPVFLSMTTKQALQAKGMRNVEYKVYDGVAHETNSQELNDIRGFLLRMLPDSPPVAATTEEIERMSVKELREFLRQYNISTTGLLEKSEFVLKAKEQLVAHR